MVAAGMVVAAVLLDRCSLAQGAPDRAPANRLEVTSERPARLLLAVGRQAAARASGRRGRVGAGSRGSWGTWTRSYPWIMQHSHTGATEGQSLEVTEMALLLVPGWRPDLPKERCWMIWMARMWCCAWFRALGGGFYWSSARRRTQTKKSRIGRPSAAMSSFSLGGRVLCTSDAASAEALSNFTLRVARGAVLCLGVVSCWCSTHPPTVGI